MFVKIINKNEENLFECDRVNSIQVTGDGNIVRLLMLKGCEVISEWEIVKSQMDVYFMNNDGKTIESWRWPKAAYTEEARPEQPSFDGRPIAG